MKRALSLLLLLAVCALAAPASADGVTFTLDEKGVITQINNFSGDALIIPAAIDEAPVKGIDNTALTQDGWNMLKYILFEHNDPKFIVEQLPDDAFNLTSANYLEAVLVCFDPYYSSGVGSVKDKFSLPSSNPPFAKYVNLEDQTLNTLEPDILSDRVELSFSDILPTDYPVEYTVTRKETSSGDTVSFSSKDRVDLFSNLNGYVTFTDFTISPGETYRYTVTARDPFGSSTQSQFDQLITIPEPVPEPVPEHVLAAIESLPDTGDRAPLLPWLLLLGASVLLLVRKKRAA